MRAFRQIGPFGKAEAFLESFIHSAARQAMFMDLIEEIDKLEEVINGDDSSKEEQKLAAMLHRQLTEQFMDMITPANRNDKTRAGKNI